MNTTDKYIACPEHHSGITRVRLNPEYVAPLPQRWPWYWIDSMDAWLCRLAERALS